MKTNHIMIINNVCKEVRVQGCDYGQPPLRKNNISQSPVSQIKKSSHTLSLYQL